MTVPDEYGTKKKSSNRESSVLEGIRNELGGMFVREVDGQAVDRWYQGLTERHGLSAGTAVRHFKVMHRAGVWPDFSDSEDSYC